MESAVQEIERFVTQWNNVTVHPHRFGGIEFRLGKRELGHLHGNRILDVPFPMKVRNQLVADGKAEPHHILPESGWITFRLHSEDDTQRAIDLLQLSYELALTAAQRRTHSFNISTEQQHL